MKNHKNKEERNWASLEPSPQRREPSPRQSPSSQQRDASPRRSRMAKMATHGFTAAKQCKDPNKLLMGVQIRIKLNEKHIVPRRLGEASSSSSKLSVLTQDR